MACYRSGGCGPYEMYSCSECPASKPEYAQKTSTCSQKEQVRLIDANALANKMQFLIRTHHRDAFDALNEIDNAPTIDPESLRPQGEWVKIWADEWVCSHCNVIYEYPSVLECGYNYCPNCGAKMKGADDHG